MRSSVVGRASLRWAFASCVLALAILELLAPSPSSAAPRVDNVSIALVDATQTDTVVSGSVAPGSVVRVQVTARVSGSADAWRSTSLSLNGGAVTCVDTKDHANAGTFSEVLAQNVTMPETGSLAVRTILYKNAGCAGTAVTQNATFMVTPATANGPLAQECQRRIVLVLDESGSIGSTNGATAAVRAGAKALVNGLIGGGSSLAVIEFNTQARIVQLGGNTFNTVDPTFANGVFATYINGHGATSSTRYEPTDYSGNNQYTNWEDALRAAGSLSPLPELVMFITDGDPTARNLTPAGQQTGLVDGSYLAMNPAFAQANAIKGNTLTTRIFAMGVGSAVSNAGSLTRLRAISGPNEFTGSNSFADSDYALVGSFSDLEEALWELAAQLCSVQVHVSKLVDSLDGKGYQPANGWNFSGTASVDGTAPANYRWLLPGTVEGPPVSNQTRTAATVDIRGQSGRLDFAWLAAPTTATSSIVLSEAARKDYHFVSVSCVKGSTPITVPQAPTVTLSGLNVHDEIACTFRNRKDQGTITIAKLFVGSPTEVSLSLDGAVRKTSSQATFDTGSLAASIGNHTVSEQFSNPALAALYESSYSCVDAAGSNVARGSGTVVAKGVDIADGDDITCTFTNRKELNGQLSKTADPDVLPEPGGQVKFSVTVVNTSRGPATLTSLHDDVYGDLDADSADAAHSWISSGCRSGVTLEGYDGVAGGADTYTCTFTGAVAGTPDHSHKDTVTIRLEDASGEIIERDASATVAFRDVLPAISVTKLAEPDYVQDRGPVTYTAVVTNTSVADTLTIDQLADSVYGDLLTGPVRATCLYGADPVTFPYRLPAGESLRCSFVVTVSATTTDTLTASGTDDEGNRATDADGAIVTVGITPPPLSQPLPPDPEAAGVPTIALSVDKSAPTKAYRGTDSTSFAYDVRVSNAGPDPAPDTMLNDPAPAGGRFGRIVHQPAQGHCVVQQGGKSLACSLGTITAGQSLSVRLPVEIPASSPGPVTNTATATCTPTPTTTPCKAKGSATTRLVAALTPARVCPTVVLSPSTFRANGVPRQIGVSVRPPAATTVSLRGPGVHVDVRTPATGKASATVTPTHAGTLTASVNGASSCAAQHFSILTAIAPAFTG